MRNKIIQKQLAFYKLYTAFKEDPERYVQIWEFVGEIHVKELNKWGLMSYTCVHRVFEVYDENPGLIERRKVTGKSGARYFEYRIAANPSAEKIKDGSVLSFYKRLKRAIDDAKNPLLWGPRKDGDISLQGVQL